MEFIIISGLSGAGKSKAASFMEDMGFFCVDNLPAPLIPKFAELGMAGHRGVRPGGYWSQTSGAAPTFERPVPGPGGAEGDEVRLPHPVYGRLGRRDHQAV